MPRIVYENEYALIIDKPVGISHHSNGEEDGIMKCLRELQASDERMYGGDLYSVHRLDRDTSGLLLFAKTKSSASFFSEQFANRKVLKYCEFIAESLFIHVLILIYMYIFRLLKQMLLYPIINRRRKWVLWLVI